MVRANSGAGGNPNPTFGRCTIFSILHQSEKKKSCCVCGKGGGRGKGVKGACVGGWVGGVVWVVCGCVCVGSFLPALVPSFWCFVLPLVPSSRLPAGHGLPPWVPLFDAMCAGSGPWLPHWLPPFGPIPPPLGVLCLVSTRNCCLELTC